MIFDVAGELVTIKANKVTLADVALAAGVSKMTASRAFARPNLVRPATRERVLEAGESLGYIPDLLASAFSSQKTKVLGVIVPTYDVSTYASAMRAISDVSLKRGYEIFVAQTKYDDALEMRAIRAFAGRKVDGILAIYSEYQGQLRDFFVDRDLPLVQLWELPGRPIDMASGVSSTKAGGLAAQHFFDKGYRSCLVCHTVTYRDRKRANGFISTARKLGMEIIDSFEIADRTVELNLYSDFGAGEEIARYILEHKKKPRAVFITDDSAAFSTVYELQRADVDVPKDVAICGFGNEEYVRYMSPSLTTIDINGYDMGVAGASMVIDRIEGVTLRSKTYKGSVTLIERDTT